MTAAESKVAWWVGLATVAACTPARTPRQDALRREGEAAEVLHEMFVRYNQATTYEDTGVVTAKSSPHGGMKETEERVEFKTSFARATGAIAFRYESTGQVGHECSRGAFWSRGAGPVNTWLPCMGEMKPQGLWDALALFTGITRGAAIHIPRMLLQDWNARLGEFVFRVEDDEAVHGVLCARLRAEEGGHVRVLWVGKENHSLRKTFDLERVDPQALANKLAMAAKEPERDAARWLEHATPWTTEVTTEYEPVFDRPIEPNHFDFTPPTPPP